MERPIDFREEALVPAVTRFGPVFRWAVLFFPEADFPAVFFAAGFFFDTGFFFDAGFVAPDFLGVDFFAAGFLEVCFFAGDRLEAGFLAAVFRFCFPEVFVFAIYFISAIS